MPGLRRQAAATNACNTRSLVSVGAVAEGFFGKLKRERVHRRRYLALAEARADVFGYIERFHNPIIQRRLDARVRPSDS